MTSLDDPKQGSDGAEIP